MLRNVSCSDYRKGLNMNEKFIHSTTVVTGGAGAIGSRLVRRLLSEGVQSIQVIDNLSSGYAWLLPQDARVQLHVHDVCDVFQLPITATQPYLFHLAAFFANQNSVDHPLADLHTNGQGTLTTLLWAQKMQASRLVYASAGCSIAGHGINAPIREDMPVSLHLDTPYQITKALGEFYCNYFQPSVSTVACRFFNSYGPGEVPGTYRNVIPNFIWRALHNQPLIITGTGDETRDFIYVDDLVDGLVRGATFPNADGQAFNLGTGIETRIGDLADLILRLTGSQSRIAFGPRRAWDKSVKRQADIRKAQQRLEFQPQVAVEEGLGRTIEWFRANYHIIRESIGEGL